MRIKSGFPEGKVKDFEVKVKENGGVILEEKRVYGGVQEGNFAR